MPDFTAQPHPQPQPVVATQPITASMIPEKKTAVENVVNAVESNPAVKFISKDIVLEMFFLIGFASIFLINSLNAWIAPTDFMKLLASNPVTKAIGHYELMLNIIMINDMIIGLLLLSRWKKKYVWAFAGFWLMMVAGIKTLYLLFLK